MPAAARPQGRDHFNSRAGMLTAYLPDGAAVELRPKRFPSGAVGWSAKAQTVYVMVGGVWLRCRASGWTLKVIGSEKWDEVQGGQVH